MWKRPSRIERGVRETRCRGPMVRAMDCWRRQRYGSAAADGWDQGKLVAVVELHVIAHILLVDGQQRLLRGWPEARVRLAQCQDDVRDAGALRGVPRKRAATDSFTERSEQANANLHSLSIRPVQHRASCCEPGEARQPDAPPPNGLTSGQRGERGELTVAALGKISVPG